MPKRRRAPEPENIYQRGRVWYGRVEIAGKELRCSLRTSDEDEARKRCEKWIEDLKIERGIKAPKPSWAEAVGRYVLEVAPESVKPGVAKRYICSLRQVDPWFRRFRVDQVTRSVIADMVSGRKRAGATNATINRDLTAVSRVLSACVSWGWRDDNPARTFDRSLTRERRDPIALPPEDHILAMLEESPPRFAQLLEVCRHTGLREKEASTLEWQHVELGKGRKAINLSKTKTDKPRSIPLDDIETSKAVSVLRAAPRYLRTHRDQESDEPPKDYMFWHDDGQPYRNSSSLFGQIRRQLNAKRKKARLPPVTFSLHHLRHLFAVSYLRQGGNIYRLQKIMGHSSIKTTEIYLAYLTPDEQMRAQHGEGVVVGLRGESAQLSAQSRT